MRRLALAAALLAAPALAQPVDSLATPTPVAPALEIESDPRTPRGAVLRSLAVPGWGQLYNGQPLKAPVAAAGVVAAALYLVDRQRQYVLYRRATVVAGCLQDPGGADDPDRLALCQEAEAEYQDEYDQLNAGRTTPLTFSTLRSVRAQARSQRDIGVVVVLAAYALQALDAYVIAELADFDVSEDLSVRLGTPVGGHALSVRVRL